MKLAFYKFSDYESYVSQLNTITGGGIVFIEETSDIIVNGHSYFGSLKDRVTNIESVLEGVNNLIDAINGEII